MLVNLYVYEQDGYFEAETEAITINTNIQELKGQPVLFYGNTKQSVIDQVIAVLKSRGLTGRLRLV